MAHESEAFCAGLADSIKKYCGTRPVLFNIGAEDGYEASYVLGRLPDATVIGIEAICGPNPFKLSRNLHGVIGATTGPTIFYVVTTDTALSGNCNRPAVVSKSIEVMQYRLDDYVRLKDLPQPTALLIDTEGTTLDVLVGSGELLREVQFICAEVQRERHSWGGTTPEMVDEYLGPFALFRVAGGYNAGGQSNLCWARG